MPKISVSTGKLISKVKKKTFRPSLFNLEKRKTSSPAFTTPLKYSAKSYLESNKTRVQTYRSLSDSLFAQLLASPPRMSHQARVTVPKDILIPMKVFESKYFNPTDDRFTHYFVPVLIGDAVDMQDPTCYYPLNNKVFLPSIDKASVSPLKKFMANLIQYNEFDSKTSVVGWPSFNYKINESHMKEEITKELQKIKSQLENLPMLDDHYVKFANNSEAPPFVVGDMSIITLNIKNLPVMDQLKSSIVDTKIPVTKMFLPFLITLTKACIYYNH